MFRVPTILSLLLVATATLEAQTTILASVSTQGAQFGQTKEAVVSPDGRYVAFTTFTGVTQEIYVRDLIQATTTIASSSSTGVPSGHICRAPSFCGDGHLIAFQSWSTTLVPGDTNGVPDIFVKDLNSGAITRVSVGPGGGESNASSDWPAMSDDGRYVAFESFASTLVPGFGAPGSAYRYDRLTGTTVAVSVSTAGGQPNGASHVPSISADGRFVAFQSEASDLVAGDVNGVTDVFVRDVVAGTTLLASVGAGGIQGSSSQLPELSRDGALVAFVTSPANLAPWSLPPAANDSVVIKVLSTGALEFVADVGGASSRSPKFSGDSRFIAFGSVMSNLVSGDTNNAVDVFVKDRLTGAVSRESIGFDWAQADADSAVFSGIPGSFNGRHPLSISADGRFVAFTSNATNLAPGDTNATSDAFVRDRSCSVVYTTFGQGTPGTGGSSPFLLGFEGPCTGGWSLFVANARGGAQGVLAASLTRAIPAVPFAGGIVYLAMDPQLLLIPFTLSGPAGVAGAGFWSLPTFDVSFLVGIRIFHQAAVFDPAAAQGIALTNALQADF